MPGEELKAWLDEYGESHQNPSNIILHKICIPAIVFSLFGMLWSLPIVPKNLRQTISIGRVSLLNASLVFVPILAFYWSLSTEMALAMLILGLIMLGTFVRMETKHWPIFRLSLLLFVVAWIGQFVGHELEGKKPAFFKDLQFLLIGPLWTLASAFRFLGIEY